MTPKQTAGLSPGFVYFITALQRLQWTVAFLLEPFLFPQGCLSPKPQPFSCALSPPRRHHRWPPGRAPAAVPSCRAASIPASGLSSLPCILIALRHHSHFARCFPELQPAWPSSAVARGPLQCVCLPAPLWEPSTPAKPVTSPPLSLTCPFLPLRICSQWCCSLSKHLPPAPLKS